MLLLKLWKKEREERNYWNIIIGTTIKLNTENDIERIELVQNEETLLLKLGKEKREEKNYRIIIIGTYYNKGEDRKLHWRKKLVQNEETLLLKLGKEEREAFGYILAQRKR